MRSIFGTPIGLRPTRPLVEYSGSITAINRAHGTTRSISAEKLLAARSLLLQTEFGTGKVALAHGRRRSRLDDFSHACRVPDVNY